ncbi:hypothetical protein BU592_12140 [Staphylococcus arlettae]|uniref:Uncharacterized protein n=1 Tax=Staphylococcus arlettae TaxID=29378 RepID=A0ABQ0XYN6_9STAP|nr:hypothetical protein CD036_00480 [Staphylococcus arlettae]PTH18570.1 hypothetical protein BU602_12395 [Staphylococcus arlettae]PTH31134.1 hypothetical protein BU592_12140 [Staphylococcus arlettae]PTH49895.1 hypothetical protein BU597_12850 [Staphylococcus arlettae]RIM58406.1 hypothetical protein BU603_06395 [Staphylococcus arlettae]
MKNSNSKRLYFVILLMKMNGNTVTKVIFFESTVLYTICLHKNSKMKTTKLYQIKIFYNIFFEDV